MGLFSSKTAIPSFVGHFLIKVVTNQKNSTNKCTYFVDSSDLSKITKCPSQSFSLVKFEVDPASNDMFLITENDRKKVGVDGDIEELDKALIYIMKNIEHQLKGETFEVNPEIEYSVKVSSAPFSEELYYEFVQSEQLIRKITGPDLAPVTFLVKSDGSMTMTHSVCGADMTEQISAGTDGDYQRNVTTFHSMIKTVEMILHPVKTVETAVEKEVEKIEGEVVDVVTTAV